MQTRLTRGTGAFVAIAAFLLVVAPALGTVLPTDLKIEKVLDTTGDVGDVLQAPDGALWVLERRSGANDGVVRTYKNGLPVSTLNIPVSSSCDNGLMDVVFSPDYSATGKAFAYYVDAGGDARVDVLLGRGTQLGGNLITIGATTTAADGKCHAGGGMDIGADGKLYIATGDLGVSANAQDPGSLGGKVLRANLDGSIPNDNASGTLVWARGFRDAVDLDTHSNGTIYVVDMGHDFNPGIDVFDELNAVHEGGNYGWPTVAQNGDDPLDLTDEPLIFAVGLATEGVEMLENSKLGPEYTDSVIYACKTEDDMRQANLSGAPLDVLDSWNLLFDPDGDFDSTPDPGCPSNINALTEGRDGMLYGANGDTNSGVWRIYNDEIGPREVSAPGSPIQLTIAKTGASIQIVWEDLGVRDASYPDQPGNQSPSVYQLYRGTLPIAGVYNHTLYFGQNGTPDGLGRLKSFAFPPGNDDQYFLMSAQNENLRGLTGTASDGTPRGPEVAPGTDHQWFSPMLDYCPDRGFGRLAGQCARPFFDPTAPPPPSPLQPMDLIDYNHNSETYLQGLNLTDFRGKVIRMDISSVNCTFCNAQAPIAQSVESQLHGRDVIGITILTQTFQNLAPIPPANCQAQISNWANSHGVTSPILCDIDMDGDGRGDVSDFNQWFNGGCGTPQNYYIDQAGVVYLYVCGGELNEPVIRARLINEVNAETCD